MIPDEFVKNLVSTGLSNLPDRYDIDMNTRTQFARGVNPFTVDCMRHMTVFKKYNVIPERCFSCFKVQVNPANVLELFKLMIVFAELPPPGDNARKCMIECREHVPGHYKGLVYCKSYNEALSIKQWIEKIVFQEISDDIMVKIKRGCSEYSVVYPEYAVLEDSAKMMSYDKEWRQYEETIDREHRFPPMPESFNQAGYSIQDAMMMYSWLKYAKTIGDASYSKIYEGELAEWSDLKRPKFTNE